MILALSELQVTTKILRNFPPNYRSDVSACDNSGLSKKRIPLLTSKKERLKKMYDSSENTADEAFFP